MQIKKESHVYILSGFPSEGAFRYLAAGIPRKECFRNLLPRFHAALCERLQGSF